MAQAPEGGMKQSFSDMDKPTKIKLIAALSVLFLAVIWIVIWSGVLSGNPNKPPSLSADEEKKLMEENAAEKAKVDAENAKSVVRPGRPLPKPAGS
jgi:hypothetical protein